MAKKSSAEKKCKFPESLLDELGNYCGHDRINKKDSNYQKLLNLIKGRPIVFNNGLSAEIPEGKDAILVLKNNRKIATIPHGSIVRPVVVKAFSSPRGSKEWGFVSTIYFNEEEESFCFCKEAIAKKGREEKTEK